MNKILLFFTITLILQSPVVGADITKDTICHPGLGSLPVLEGGRVKPLSVLAKETLNFITPKSTLKKYGLQHTPLFCQMSLGQVAINFHESGSNESSPSESFENFPIKVEHNKVKALLGMEENETSVSISKLRPSAPSLNIEYSQLKLNDAYKKEINRVLIRLQKFESLIRGTLWQIPVKSQQTTDEQTAFGFWIPLSTFLETHQEELQATTLDQYLMENAKGYEAAYPQSTHRLEKMYFDYNPFAVAIIVTLMSLMILFPRKYVGVTIIFPLISVALQVIAMTMRVLISGRAPITNMYETVMFSGFGALVIALVIFYFKREKMFLIAGLCYNLLCLLMMRFAGSMLDPSISPLVPVLRDNFWLSTHVTTVILSYAALALSWILANIVLIKGRLQKIQRQTYQHLVKMIHICVQIGVVSLAAGIILGGVWADYSWGRFWGWDPKETWSLIVLLIYIAILHGKYTNWIPPQRYVPLIAASFLSVMMAWFGVNYILAAGLHSYGFSEGGATFLASFFIVQIVIILLTYKSHAPAKIL